MEQINQYVQLHAWHDEQVLETACAAVWKGAELEVTYTLFQTDCLFDFSAMPNVVQLRIAATYFDKYEEPFDVVVAKQSICCNTQSKLYELLTSNLEGIARKVFLESSILYLLYQVQKNNLVFQLNCDTCSFLNRPLEAEKIHKAKEYILANLDTSITIASLALHVGTNQCYLKKGFKELYGQTIFECIQEHKMVKAKHLLSQSSLTLQEISMAVGYASLSSFSQTYKNYFGISPSMEKKQIPDF